VVEVVVVDVELVVVEEVVVVVDVEPKIGRVVEGMDTLFGQYCDGYPMVSRRSPTYSKCMPSLGQKLPPHAKPHFLKIRTTSQFIFGTDH
jgi:hypothetical protein